MIYDPEIENRDPKEQRRLDEVQYRKQIKYLLDNSKFYQRKLTDAGFKDAESLGGLDDMAPLPFTVKDEIRQTQADNPPFGDYLAAPRENIRKVFSTSGTTGTPCYIALTMDDLDVWATHTARSYTAVGFRPGEPLAVILNAGPFAGGAAYYGFDKLGAMALPIGMGNTERLVKAMQLFSGGNMISTPSYTLYLLNWCREHGVEPRSLKIKHMGVAGEPGGGDPALREEVEGQFGCTLREAMGTGDISTSIWGECEEGKGMHFSGQGLTHVELIDPGTEQPIPWEDGAEGEAIYTSLVREAMPVLRIRSRDHLRVTMQPCSCGRISPRVRCIGRTDDMLIVRGVNLFPTAVRSVILTFRPEVGEVFLIRPVKNGVSQDPPLPIVIELGDGISAAPAGLAEKIEKELRSRLLVATKVEFVAGGTLPRGEYKTAMVDYSKAN